MKEEIKEKSHIKVSKVLYTCYRNSRDKRGCWARVVCIYAMAELLSEFNLKMQSPYRQEELKIEEDNRKNKRVRWMHHMFFWVMNRWI